MIRATRSAAEADPGAARRQPCWTLRGGPSRRPHSTPIPPQAPAAPAPPPRAADASHPCRGSRRPQADGMACAFAKAPPHPWPQRIDTHIMAREHRGIQQPIQLRVAQLALPAALAVVVPHPANGPTSADAQRRAIIPALQADVTAARPSHSAAGLRPAPPPTGRGRRPQSRALRRPYRCRRRRRRLHNRRPAAAAATTLPGARPAEWLVERSRIKSAQLRNEPPAHRDGAAPLQRPSPAREPREVGRRRHSRACRAPRRRAWRACPTRDSRAPPPTTNHCRRHDARPTGGLCSFITQPAISRLGPRTARARAAAPERPARRRPRRARARHPRGRASTSDRADDRTPSAGQSARDPRPPTHRGRATVRARRGAAHRGFTDRRRAPRDRARAPPRAACRARACPRPTTAAAPKTRATEQPGARSTPRRERRAPRTARGTARRRRRRRSPREPAPGAAAPQRGAGPAAARPRAARGVGGGECATARPRRQCADARGGRVSSGGASSRPAPRARRPASAPRRTPAMRRDVWSARAPRPDQRRRPTARKSRRQRSRVPPIQLPAHTD